MRSRSARTIARGLFITVIQLAVVAGALPGAAGNAPGPIERGSEKLSSMLFTFQNPLIGVAHTRTCYFNVIDCADAGKHHTGIDEGGGIEGKTIRAANFGEVVLIKYNGGDDDDHNMGNSLVLRYLMADGSYLWDQYSHMQDHQPQLSRPGQSGVTQIPRGTKIGTVGGTGDGGTPWPPHLHYEVKLGPADLGNPLPPGNPIYWGYTLNSATAYGYKNPDDYLGNPAVTLLIPEFSVDGSGWGDYDIFYAIAGRPLYARLAFTDANEAFSNVCVAVRSWTDDEHLDFPCEQDVGVGLDPESQYPYSYIHATVKDPLEPGEALKPGDYTLFAALQPNDPPGAEWRSGYRSIFTILPSPNDLIRDNDMTVVFFSGSPGLDQARLDGYGFGAFAAVGGTGAWGEWYPRAATHAEPWVYVGGGGNGTVTYRLYPDGTQESLIVSDPVNLGDAPYQWRRLTANGGSVASFLFSENGYIRLAADDGTDGDVYLFDAIKFKSDLVGYFMLFDWRIHSPIFYQAYQQHGGSEALGYAFDHGGTEFIHWWSNPYFDPSEGVWIQDLKKHEEPRLWPDGHTALIWSEEQEEVFLLKEGFWAYYMTHHGYANLGAPASDEYDLGGNIIHQDFEKGRLSWDPSAPGDGISHYNNDGTVPILYHDVTIVSTSQDMEIWNARTLLGVTPVVFPGCEGCTYQMIAQPTATKNKDLAQEIEINFVVESGPKVIYVDEPDPVDEPGSGQITAPTGNQTGNTTVAATAADPNGVETVGVDFAVGGPRLTLCQAGACVGTGPFSVGDVDPGAYGVDAGGLVTLRLYVADSLGNEEMVDTQSFTLALHKDLQIDMSAALLGRRRSETRGRAPTAKAEAVRPA